MNISLSTYDRHHSPEQLIDLISSIKFTITNCWLWSTITNLECRSDYSQKVDEANLWSCNLHLAGWCQHGALWCLHPWHGSRRSATGSSNAWCEMWCVGWQQGEGHHCCPQTPESSWMLSLRVEDSKRMKSQSRLRKWEWGCTWLDLEHNIPLLECWGQLSIEAGTSTQEDNLPG